MAAFRMPHHYLLYSFSKHAVLRFGFLAIVGLSALLYPRIRRRLRFSPFITRALLIIGLGCLVGFVFTEVFPVLVFAKFQLFKLTVLAKLFFVILVCHAVFVVLPVAVRKPLDTLLKYPYWGLAVTLILLTIVVINVTNGPLRDFVGPFARANQPIGRLEQWAKTETPHDAIFAVPPSFSSFRSGSHRTIVVNFKSVPFTDRDLVTWFERLTDLAPITLPERGGSVVLEALDDEYNRIPADTLIQLRDKYGFHYVVREQPLDEDQTFFDRVLEVGPWIVYHARITEPEV